MNWSIIEIWVCLKVPSIYFQADMLQQKKKKRLWFLKKKMIIKGILYFLNEVTEGSNILEDSG